MKRRLVAICIVLAAASIANADIMIGAVSVSSPQGNIGGIHDIGNIINQSGLSAAYTSGVTDFATFAAGTTHLGLTGTGFTGSETQGPQQFTFDLGAVTLINGVAVWNTTSVGAISSFSLLADTDSDFGNGVSATLVAATALATPGSPVPAQVFSFAPTATRYVHFNGLSSLAPPDYYGLGEVAFSVVPTPSAVLLGCIGLGMASRRLKRRKTV